MLLPYKVQYLCLPPNTQIYLKVYGGLPIHHAFIKDSERGNIKVTSLPDNKQPDYPFLYIDWCNDDSSTDSETSDWACMLKHDDIGGGDSSDDDDSSDDYGRGHDSGSIEDGSSSNDGSDNDNDCVSDGSDDNISSEEELVVKRNTRCKVKAVFDSSDDDE